jgi:hypothetical protein
LPSDDVRPKDISLRRETELSSIFAGFMIDLIDEFVEAIPLEHGLEFPTTQ